MTIRPAAKSLNGLCSDSSSPPPPDRNDRERWSDTSGGTNQADEATTTEVMRHSNRPNGVFKKGNDYQRAISEIYEKTPKAVFAALVVDLLLIANGENFDIITSKLLEEWEILYKNGIVPQKPVRI